MTLIIYHKGTVYADRIVSSNGAVLGQTTKVFLKDNKVIGACGSAIDCQKFINLYPNIVYKETFTEEHSAGFTFFFDQNKPKVQIYKQAGMSEYEILDEIFAIGLGEEFALGLLFAGKLPEETFKLVNMYYPIIHGPIDSIKIPHD